VEAARPYVYHFSEDPNIERLVPHVPPTNPSHPPAVWAIDADHAPLYWFPRDCPRIAVWPSNEAERQVFRQRFHTTSDRLHAIELAWLDRMRSATIYRYDLPADTFEPWVEAGGQFVSDVAVEPLGMTRLDDLLGTHATAGVELRLVVSLWPLIDEVTSDEFEFSIVRKHNAAHRLG
jgi:hypothetical protein